jgi:hypothetical protein
LCPLFIGRIDLPLFLICYVLIKFLLTIAGRRIGSRSGSKSKSRSESESKYLNPYLNPNSDSIQNPDP